MPLFDFICGDCKEVYERFMKSDTVAHCQKCGSYENQRKVISPPRIAYATSNDTPKNSRDLAHYLGNGEYIKGYER